MGGQEFVVAIISIIFGYLLVSGFIKQYFRSRNYRDSSFGDKDTELIELNQRTIELLDRIEKLESILDKDLPGWRNRI